MYLEDTFLNAYILTGTKSLGFLFPECSEQIFLPYLYSLKAYLYEANKFSKANNTGLASESTDCCLEEVVSKAVILWHNFLYGRRTLY